jgi:hypothetical protein
MSTLTDDGIILPDDFADLLALDTESDEDYEDYPDEGYECGGINEMLSGRASFSAVPTQINISLPPTFSLSHKSTPSAAGGSPREYDWRADPIGGAPTRSDATKLLGSSLGGVLSSDMMQTSVTNLARFSTAVLDNAHEDTQAAARVGSYLLSRSKSGIQRGLQPARPAGPSNNATTHNGDSKQRCRSFSER